MKLADVIDIAGGNDSDDSQDSQRTMTYPDPPLHTPAAASASFVPTAVSAMQFSPHHGFVGKCPAQQSNLQHPVIPAMLVQVWLQVKENQEKNGQPKKVEPGMCSSSACVFSRGGLFRQYYACVERLVQLDNTLRDTLYAEPEV